MGISEKALKLRIKSVESTEHITRAMQLVASSKLRRSTERMEVSRAYFKEMKTVFADLYESCGGELPEGLFTESQKGDRCLVVIAGPCRRIQQQCFFPFLLRDGRGKGKDGNSASGQEVL